MTLRDIVTQPDGLLVGVLPGAADPPGGVPDLLHHGVQLHDHHVLRLAKLGPGRYDSSYYGRQRCWWLLVPAGGELGAAALGGDGEAVGGRPAPRLEVPGQDRGLERVAGQRYRGRAFTPTFKLLLPLLQKMNRK